MVNAIVWDNPSWEIVGPCTVSYSDVRGYYPGEGNLHQWPGFVDFDGRDLRLTGDSPGIDAADGAMAPPTDLVGVEPYDHPAVIDVFDCADAGEPCLSFADLGAYEYVSP